MTAVRATVNTVLEIAPPSRDRAGLFAVWSAIADAPDNVSIRIDGILYTHADRESFLTGLSAAINMLPYVDADD